MTQQLVSAAWLAAHLNDPTVRIVDVRWALTEAGAGRREYEAAHIPGAVHLDIDADLAASPFDGPGRHPIPSAAVFAATLGRAGIGNDTHVVAYDANGGAWAARLWWLLRAFGHTKVSLLDGGWQAWQAGGSPTEAGIASIEPAQFTAHTTAPVALSADDVEALRHKEGTLLIDARAPERYHGLVEPVDSKAGHIPGAKNYFFGKNLNEDMTFKSPEELRATFTQLGVEDAEQVVCYCGSGVTASHNLFAMELAGLPGAQLYEGSWSDWSRDPARDVATGEN